MPLDIHFWYPPAMRNLQVVFVMLFACLLNAADVSGKWNFHVVLDAGSGDPEFVLLQKGEALTGTYTGTLGRVEVRGTVKGDDVEILFDAGNEAIQYVGKLDGSDKMKGTVKYGSLGSGVFTAQRSK